MVFGGETADSYYDEGVTASMKGDVALAVQHFEKALQLDPYHVSSCHQLGKCKVRQGELQLAVEYFYRTIKARPNPIAPRIDLASALLEGGNIPKAEDLFNEVVAKKPENTKALLGLAGCAFQKGEWDNAYILAKQVMDLGGGGFAALYLLGRSARLAGFLDVAAESFETADKLLEKSIESDPDQPEGYFLRGELSFARENFPAALDSFQAAESRLTADTHYYSYGEHFDSIAILAKRGMCLYRLERLAEAKELGSQILERQPGNKIARFLVQKGETA
jgi:tetratricopeptide (TPR) repeat protein